MMRNGKNLSRKLPDWFVEGRNEPADRSHAVPRLHGPRIAAFTLLEVMIAMGIFFMCIFAILGLVSANLRNARLLQRPVVDASMLIAELSQTNKLVEGVETGDFGDLYPGYRWTREINQVKTNGLFQVDFVVTPPAHDTRIDTHMSVLLWRPDSAAGKAFGTK
jgi:hypothetical protein